MIESGAFGPNTTSSLFNGKSYNKGIRGHKLLAECLQRLRWKEFMVWTESNEVELDQESLMLAVSACREAFKEGGSRSNKQFQAWKRL